MTVSSVGFKFSGRVCPICSRCLGDMKKADDPTMKKGDVIFVSGEKSICPFCGYEVVPDFWVSQDYDMIMAVYGAKGLQDSEVQEKYHKDRYAEQQER